FEPGIQSADERSQRSASRAPDRPQACRIYFGPARQIIKRSFRIPNKIAGDALPYENVLRARLNVLRDRPPCQRTVHARIIGLLPLALADGIERKYDKALQSEIRSEPLPFRLAFLGMTCLQKNSRVAPSLVRPVQIRGHIKARQALEDHLFNRIVISLNSARDRRIEGTVVLRQPANNRQKCLAHPALPALRIGDVFDLGDGVFATLQLLLRNLIHPPQKGVRSNLLSVERS